MNFFASRKWAALRRISLRGSSSAYTCAPLMIRLCPPLFAPSCFFFFGQKRGSEKCAAETAAAAVRFYIHMDGARLRTQENGREVWNAWRRGMKVSVRIRREKRGVRVPREFTGLNCRANVFGKCFEGFVTVLLYYTISLLLV